MRPRPGPPALLGLLLLLRGLGASAPGGGGAEHRPDYDREALLGGQEEVEEFSKLSPEEQEKRLKGIIKKMDGDADGFLTEAELSSWIQQSFKHYIMEDAKQQFSEYDKNGDGHVTWEEYNIQMYDHVIDFDDETTLEDAEEESFRQTWCCLKRLHGLAFRRKPTTADHKGYEKIRFLIKGIYKSRHGILCVVELHLKDKKRFEKANRDATPGLDLNEFIAFEHPEEVEYMKELVIQEALDEHDKDEDGFVSLEEFLGDYQRDPTAGEDPEWILVEKDRFRNDYDKDKDEKLNPKELLSWVVPNNEGIAREEAVHLIDEMDLDGNRKLTESEILENQDLFLNSEATDYGRQLHDEHFYHDEL